MRSLVLAAALALSPAAHAGDPPKLVTTRTFQVVDLVTPIPDLTLPAGKTPADKVKAQSTLDAGTKLVRTITAIVKPDSWEGQGGTGKIEYFDAGHQMLVVEATPEVLKEVWNLLEALRKLQDVNVVTEVRVISVVPGFREAVGVKCGDGAVLSERELTALIKAAQADRHVTIMQAPKVKTFDGQVATVRVGEEQMFVTGLDAMRVKGQAVFVPKNTPAHIGDALTLCGRVGGDGKSVTLRVNLTRTQVAGKVELVPVTTQIMPIFEGGSQGVPVPFTQYLQTPEFKTFTAERTATVPSCGTVVVGGWKESVPASFGPPFLSKIPYLNRMYKNVGPDEREVIVLATTRVVTPGDVEVKAVAPYGDAVVPPHPVMVRAVRATGQAMPAAPVPVVYPERYNTAARQEVIAPFAPQVNNGYVLNQTVWNWHFEPGSDKLTPTGVEKIQSLTTSTAAVRGRVFIQTAHDAPQVSEKLNSMRTVAVQKQLAGRPVTFEVLVHDPVVPPAPVPAPQDVTIRTQRLLYSGEGGGPSPDAKQVQLQMAFVEVPADFMTKLGLQADATKDTTVWTMTPRERDMFSAALRNTPDLKILARPQIVTHEGRPANVRAGGTTPVFTGLDVSMKDGNTVVVPKTTNVDHGITASVMPMPAADGKSIRLHVAVTQATTTELGRKRAVLVPVTPTTEHGPRVPDPVPFHLEELPKQDVQSIDTAVVVPEAGTVVIGGIVSKTPGGKGATGPKATELLIVLTPNLLKAKPEATVTPVVPAGAKLPGVEYKW